MTSSHALAPYNPRAPHIRAHPSPLDVPSNPRRPFQPSPPPKKTKTRPCPPFAALARARGRTVQDQFWFFDVDPSARPARTRSSANYGSSPFSLSHPPAAMAEACRHVPPPCTLVCISPLAGPRLWGTSTPAQAACRAPCRAEGGQPTSPPLPRLDLWKPYSRAMYTLPTITIERAGSESGAAAMPARARGMEAHGNDGGPCVCREGCPPSGGQPALRGVDAVLT